MEVLEQCDICHQGGPEYPCIWCDDCDGHFHLGCLDKKDINFKPEHGGAWYCKACTEKRLQAKRDKEAAAEKRREIKKMKFKPVVKNPMREGQFIAKVDSVCNKCGQRIIKDESHISWARTGQWRGQHFHTKCRQKEWPALTRLG